MRSQKNFIFSVVNWLCMFIISIYQQLLLPAHPSPSQHHSKQVKAALVPLLHSICLDSPVIFFLIQRVWFSSCFGQNLGIHHYILYGDWSPFSAASDCSCRSLTRNDATLLIMAPASVLTNFLSLLHYGQVVFTQSLEIDSCLSIWTRKLTFDIHYWHDRYHAFFSAWIYLVVLFLGQIAIEFAIVFESKTKRIQQCRT